MKTAFTIGADYRDTQGKGASRRLRHRGKVPAILYGGREAPQALVLDQQNLLTMVDNERFYSSIVQLKISNNGQTQEAIVKDVQMHPARNLVIHVDLQRVLPDEKVRIRLPIHFKGESVAPGVKNQGGIISHRLSDVEVSCLPKDLPEHLELDLSNMGLNETLFLSDIPVPEGVTLTELSSGRNPPVVSIHSPRAEEPEAATEAAAATTEAAAAPAAAASADAGAKKEGGKK